MPETSPSYTSQGTDDSAGSASGLISSAEKRPRVPPSPSLGTWNAGSLAARLQADKQNEGLSPETNVKVMRLDLPVLYSSAEGEDMI